jgi:AcrR family transcriptional regulator
LLLAAAAVLAEGPPTIARIVEHAGVGRSTFYEFFDSPEHILEHLEQRALRTLEAALDAAFTAARTPLERVRALMRNWLTEIDAHAAEARVALTRRFGSDLLSPAGKLMHRGLERVVEAARGDGLAWFNAADDVSLVAAAAAVETLSRRHLAGEPLRDAPRVLGEIVMKLLR